MTHTVVFCKKGWWFEVDNEGTCENRLAENYI